MYDDFLTGLDIYIVHSNVTVGFPRFSGPHFFLGGIIFPDQLRPVFGLKQTTLGPNLVGYFDAVFDIKHLRLKGFDGIFVWDSSADIDIVNTNLGGGFKYFNFHPYLGKIPIILTHIFQMG